MLQPDNLMPLGDSERQWFHQLVPEHHFLRQLIAVIDFEGFRPVLASTYCPDDGRSPLDPVFMLKLEVLALHYRLSDRELMKQVQVNAAYRLFLGLSCRSPLPHHTSMTYFRERIGAARMQEIFHVVLGRRELGLVRDRLRLKDATHVLANIAVPSTIRLVADTREQLLQALRPFAADRADEETRRPRKSAWSATTCPTRNGCCGGWRMRGRARLGRRRARRGRLRAADAAAQEKLRAALALTHKVLADRDDPKTGDKVVSVQDPDARCGKHGDFYDGYLVDLAMDADSELITGIHVLPANGDEGGDAAHLLRQEEAAHGNDVAALSIDGAGYRGDVLRELTDPNGLNVEVFTPPRERIPLTVFGPEQFVLGADGQTLTCPAGQTTKQHERNAHGTGAKFRFAKKQCSDCALREQCLSDPKTKGRTVVKNDYEAEYQAAQAKAKTPEYAKVRKQHPAIERKLSELVRRHDLRHARYRGLAKVLRQGWLTALVVNLKRLVRLLPAVAPSTGTVRAALVGGD